MLELQLEEGERVVGAVAVYRLIDTDGHMVDHVLSDDGQGGELDLPTAVGMLAVGQHTMLCDTDVDR